MVESGIAVKAFIVKGGKLLVIKRSSEDPYKSGAWDIPGGRLDAGEDPFEGLKREALEETGLNIEIIMPIAINHFTRDDGQVITMIISLCKPLSENVALSEEHVEYRWLEIKEVDSLGAKWLSRVAADLLKYNLDRFIA